MTVSLSSWSLPSLFLAFTCTKREYCLCIHFHKPKVVPYECTIPTYMRYLTVAPSKFSCAKLETFKWYMFCMLEQLMFQLGLSVSSMLGGLFSRWVLIHLSFTRKWLVIGMPNSMLKSNQNIITNKTPLGLLLVWTVPRCFGWPWSVLVGGRGV